MSLFNYKVHDLYNPVLSALHSLGGSASVSEIEDFVIEFMNLSEDEVSCIHRGTSTKLNYRLRWARNHLKHFGVLENSSRAIWALTAKGQKTISVYPADVLKVAHNLNKTTPSELPESLKRKVKKFPPMKSLNRLMLKLHGKKWLWM